jgi:hypothetical protein
MEHPEALKQSSVGTDDRRRHDRVPGPFDGRRIGALVTPVRIYDLSEGGCFINSTHEQPRGIRFSLEIDLPFEGTIVVKAETLYEKFEFGYAVRFVDVAEQSAMLLQRSLLKLQRLAPYDDQ